jgi:branched-chain amino acid transport system substrate-binding protein
MIPRTPPSLAVIAVALVVLAVASPSPAQTENTATVPYASIQSNPINYLGPGREASYDLPGSKVRIGLIVPLSGPEKADGGSIVAAARLALDDDAAQGPLPGGRSLDLAVGDESGPSWGRVANALLHLVMSDQAVAIVTSTHGSTAHLSEQVGNRLGVAVLTLASDKTTTQIDLPWIFRLAPSDTVQARTMARNIYRARGFRRVLLVTEDDHDGRLGGSEFEDAAREFDAPSPARVSVDPQKPDSGALLAELQAASPQAIVFWTRTSTAVEFLHNLHEAGIFLPTYLCQEAAQTGSGLYPGPAPAKADSEVSGVWTVARAESVSSLWESFARRYRQVTGEPPGVVAAEAYDAVRLIARAVREAGPNRARVRDRIAGVRNLNGISGMLSFDNEGNSLGEVKLVRLADHAAGANP